MPITHFQPSPAAARRPLTALLLLPALLAAPIAVQAQSSYVVTTLSGSFSSDEDLQLDSQNRVLGSILLKVGSRPNYYWWLPREPINASFMAQWAQPIFGSTVSATQLSKQAGFLAAASPNGDKLVADKLGLYNRATKVFQAIPGGMYPVDVNNTGVVVGVRSTDPTPPGEPVSDSNNPDAWKRGLAWTPGQTSVITLPTGSFTGAAAYSINNAGVIAGAVFKAPSKANMRAARWANGVLEVLDDEPGKVSLARDISEGGHVLITKWTVQITPMPSQVTPGGIYNSIDQIDPIHGLIHQGTFTQIVSSIPGYTAVRARQVNASGTVIGTVYSDPPPPGGTYKTPRAFIWQNGQMQDLTTLAISKGAKLPAGTIFNNVVSINDQGSLVAGFDHPSTNRQVYVRLQAKP